MEAIMVVQARGGSDESRPGRPRASLALLAGCVALALFAYRELLRFQVDRRLPEELEEWFFVPSDTLGPMVLVLSGWLLYRRIGRLRALPDAGGSFLVGGSMLAAGLAVYAWATYTAAPDLLVPALMLHGAAAAWLWRGPAALRVVRLPLVLLIFAIPIPSPALNLLVFRLQIATTEIAGFSLYLLGIPHFVAGEQILRTEHTFSIIESCSGLRSIQTLTLMAVLMADLFRRPTLHVWLLLLAAPAVAFLLNGLRALLLILNPHSEVAAIHNLQGVVILLGGLVVLFLWDELLERLLPKRADRSPTPSVSSTATPGGAVAALAMAAVLAGAGALSLWFPRFEAPAAVRLDASARIAAAIGISEELEIDRRFLGSVGFQESFARRFVTGEDDVFLFLGIGNRSSRARSPLSPKTGIPASGWLVESLEEVPLEGGVLARARVMRNGSRRMLVYHWYQGAAGWGWESLRALLALDRSPWRQPGEILAVRLGVPIHGPLATGRVTAEQELLRIYDQLRPLLVGLETQLGRKRFSRFYRSGKRFSFFSAARGDSDPYEIRYLRRVPDAAWDLLTVVLGDNLCPRGSVGIFTLVGQEDTRIEA